MALDWLPRDDELKDHSLFDESLFSDQVPGVIYNLRPVLDNQGLAVPYLYNAWIVLNNPDQLNSYTTEMVKAVIAGFNQASMDRRVVAVIFTGVGYRAFCTGGNTKEYAEHYAGRPEEYGAYMRLFIPMVDAILDCKKLVICRVNGMRVAGGQEIGMACDISVATDTAVFGQAGPRHGSAPVGGSTDFLPWFLSIEDAMWSCISCEFWSAYKMRMKGLISKVVPVLIHDGKFVPDPTVITDRFLDNGQIVYGEILSREKDEGQRALEFKKTLSFDSSQLDAEVEAIPWMLTNRFTGCLAETIFSLRQKKKFWWDQCKAEHERWLAANMAVWGEGFLGFTAFNNRRQTGKDVIDFVLFHQLLAQGHPMDQALAEAVLPKPKE